MAGGATLTVELASLSGSLGFRALEVWTGVFAGPNHEEMGGVLERTDLTAGFAGRR